MIGLTESKYIGLISPRLRNYKKKTTELYNFSCPLCGDSSKNKLKARGFFFSKGAKTFFYCHNCCLSLTFASFLKEFDHNLFRDYLMDTLYKKDPIESPRDIPEKIYDDKTKTVLEYLDSLSDLPDSHPAVLYLIKRKIPMKQWHRIYYTDNFKKLVKMIDPEKAENLIEEPRIVFPFFNVVNKIIAVQGRALSKKSIRYVTIKATDQPKIYGLETIDPEKTVYVTEGPIDSLFLDNCLAAAGSDAKIPYKNAVWIYDNEKNNSSICKRMLKSINEGYSIFIWPHGETAKDLNDWILEGGCKPRELQAIIDANTYKGLLAQIQMNRWKSKI